MVKHPIVFFLPLGDVTDDESYIFVCLYTVLNPQEILLHLLLGRKSLNRLPISAHE